MVIQSLVHVKCSESTDVNMHWIITFVMRLTAMTVPSFIISIIHYEVENILIAFYK